MYGIMHIHVGIYICTYVCSNNTLISLPVLLGSIFAFFVVVLDDDFATVCNANLKLLTEGLIL